MLAYWMMFFFPAAAALSQRRANGKALRHVDLGWVLTWLALTLLIGYRIQVGGDWGAYLRMYYTWELLPLSYLFQAGDPGYFLLNWLSSQLGWGIYGVNLMAGAIFATGLVVFCRRQSRPWLALLVAIPYLVIVVGMGYTRQAIAIGFAMLALVALSEKSVLKFVAWLLVGALFHKSAVVLLPLAIFATRRGRWWTVLWVGATIVFLYVSWLDEASEAYMHNYVAAGMDSQGAAVRVAMNALPALIFLLYSRRMEIDPHTQRVWTWLSVFALLMVPILIVSPSSTAVDRVSLYFIPVQLFVLSRIPDLVQGAREIRRILLMATIAYAAIVQSVWLNFATHARLWVPYRFYPFELF